MQARQKEFPLNNLLPDFWSLKINLINNKTFVVIYSW